MAVSFLPKINVEEKVTEATGTDDAANLGITQTPSLCPNSAYFLPNCTDSTDTPQASFRQRREEETSQNTLVSTAPNDKNPIKTRVNDTLNAIDPSDTNWWARRDLNPQNKTDKPLNDIAIQENKHTQLTSNIHHPQNTETGTLNTIKQKNIVSAVIEITKLNISDDQKAKLIQLFLSKTEHIE